MSSTPGDVLPRPLLLCCLAAAAAAAAATSAALTPPTFAVTPALAVFRSTFAKHMSCTVPAGEDVAGEEVNKWGTQLCSKCWLKHLSKGCLEQMAAEGGAPLTSLMVGCSQHQGRRRGKGGHGRRGSHRGAVASGCLLRRPSSHSHAHILHRYSRQQGSLRMLGLAHSLLSPAYDGVLIR